MPNLPAAIGAGATGWVAGPGLSDEDRTLTQEILGAAGWAKELKDETAIDAWTAIAGSGPAYVFHLIEALQAAAQTLGFDRETATKMALETTLGSARLAESEPGDVGTLRENVTSPGGTTAAGLNVLMPELTDLITRTAVAAHTRAQELR